MPLDDFSLPTSALLSFSHVLFDSLYVSSPEGFYFAAQLEVLSYSIVVRYPEAIDNRRRTAEVLSCIIALRIDNNAVGEFQILLERKGVMDEISLRYETIEDTRGGALDEITRRLGQRLKVKTNLTFHLIPEKQGALPRYELKAKRFRDLRQL